MLHTNSPFLAIESSCDDTAVAIVRPSKEIVSHVVLSQLKQHTPYGGVVPELASRAHLQYLPSLIEQALQEASMDISEMQAIAATGGPGLIGGLLVGVMTAKGLAYAARKPFIPVNHLVGHALTVRLTSEVRFPYLLLLVSGGHCQILIVESPSCYKQLGATLDDAVGEAFDKVGKMLGLGYPGGPKVEKHALNGNPRAYPLPLSMVGKEGCDMSFSGLKTAVKRIVDSVPLPERSENFVNDMCASFQETVSKILANRVENAIKIFQKFYPEVQATLVVAGGVAANNYLRQTLQTLADHYHMEFEAPPLKLCTDNAAMIAWAAIEHYKAGTMSPFNFEPRARWPLTEL